MSWKPVGGIQFSKKQADAIGELCDNKIWVGQIYDNGKEKRHVTMVFMPRGALCEDAKYAKTLKYVDSSVPKVAYKVGDKNNGCTAAEFIKWLGAKWEADEAPPTSLDQGVVDAGRAALGVGNQPLKGPEYEKETKKKWRSPTNKKNQ